MEPGPGRGTPGGRAHSFPVLRALRPRPGCGRRRKHLARGGASRGSGGSAAPTRALGDGRGDRQRRRRPGLHNNPSETNRSARQPRAAGSGHALGPAAGVGRPESAVPAPAPGRGLRSNSPPPPASGPGARGAQRPPRSLHWRRPGGPGCALAAPTPGRIGISRRTPGARPRGGSGALGEVRCPGATPRVGSRGRGRGEASPPLSSRPRATCPVSRRGAAWGPWGTCPGVPPRRPARPSRSGRTPGAGRGRRRWAPGRDWPRGRPGITGHWSRSPAPWDADGRPSDKGPGVGFGELCPGRRAARGAGAEPAGAGVQGTGGDQAQMPRPRGGRHRGARRCRRGGGRGPRGFARPLPRGAEGKRRRAPWRDAPERPVSGSGLGGGES